MIRNNNLKKAITYTISKVDTTDDMYITVQNGEVEIVAPSYFTNKQIQDLMNKKREWILSKINEYSVESKSENKGIVRNPVSVLGKKYKLKITYKNIKFVNIDVEDNEIIIELSNKYKGKDNKKILNIAIDRLYKTIADKEVENVMEKTRILLGYAPKDYKIEKLNKQYAKCEKGVITINPEIVKFDRKTIEKIILEQYLKLRFKTESDKYKTALKKFSA